MTAEVDKRELETKLAEIIAPARLRWHKDSRGSRKNHVHIKAQADGIRTEKGECVDCSG